MNPRKKHTSVTQLPPELWTQVIYPRFLDTNTLGKIQITQKAKYSEVNETLFNTENLLNRWLQADLLERANLISLLKINPHFLSLRSKNNKTLWEKLLCELLEGSDFELSEEESVRVLILLDPRSAFHVGEYLGLPVLSKSSSNWAVLLNLLLTKKIKTVNIDKAAIAMSQSSSEDRIFMERLNESIKTTILARQKNWGELREINGDVYTNLMRADLFNAELKGANLKAANLMGADLAHADLMGADLSFAFLIAANLYSAELKGANLKGADLTEAHLQQAKLKDANLNDADLREACLAHAELHGADLMGANLYNATLSFAHLYLAKLEGADLCNAYLNDADLRGANLYYANLECATLRQAKLQGARLKGANLIGADVEGAYLTDAYLTHANLTKAIFTNAKLQRADLKGANLTEAYLPHADLTRANLKDANLEGADLTNANLSCANLIKADLTNVKLKLAYLVGATLRKAKLQHADLMRANLEHANLEGANLTNANLFQANLNDTKLIGADLTNAYLMGALLNRAILIGVKLSDKNRQYAKNNGAILSISHLATLMLDSDDIDLMRICRAEIKRLISECSSKNKQELLHQFLNRLQDKPLPDLIHDLTHCDAWKKLRSKTFWSLFKNDKITACLDDMLEGLSRFAASSASATHQAANSAAKMSNR